MVRQLFSPVQCVCILVAGIWLSAAAILFLRLHVDDTHVYNHSVARTVSSRHQNFQSQIAFSPQRNDTSPALPPLNQGLPPLLGKLRTLEQFTADQAASPKSEVNFGHASSTGVVEIAFIRHGQAESNLPTADCFGLGAIRDPKLTSMGHRQARSAGELLRQLKFFPTHIYVSPLSRTLQTCHEVKRGLDIQAETIALSFLQEMNLNDCDIGRPVAQLLKDSILDVEGVDFFWLLPDWFRIKHKNTSSFRAGFKRQWRSLLSTMSAGKHLVVSHRGALEWLLQLPERGESSFDNGEVRIFRLQPRWEDSLEFPFLQEHPVKQSGRVALNAPVYWPPQVYRSFQKVFIPLKPSRSMRVWFARHGQAMHNIVDCHDCIGSLESKVVVDRAGRNLNHVLVTCADCKDPNLTLVGRRQALDSHERLRKFLEAQEGRAFSSSDVAMYFERIFFSPLSRTLDTMGLLIFGKGWLSDGISSDTCSEDHVGECLMTMSRLVAEPLVQETSAGWPDALWDTGLDPGALQAKFKRFPRCCERLAVDWMRPTMNVQQRITEFNKKYLDARDSLTDQGLDLLVVSHQGAISTFLPGRYLQNGEIQRCEYDRATRHYIDCQKI